MLFPVANNYILANCGAAFASLHFSLPTASNELSTTRQAVTWVASGINGEYQNSAQLLIPISQGDTAAWIGFHSLVSGGELRAARRLLFPVFGYGNGYVKIAAGAIKLTLNPARTVTPPVVGGWVPLIDDDNIIEFVVNTPHDPIDMWQFYSGFNSTTQEMILDPTTALPASCSYDGRYLSFDHTNQTVVGDFQDRWIVNNKVVVPPVTLTALSPNPLTLETAKSVTMVVAMQSAQTSDVTVALAATTVSAGTVTVPASVVIPAGSLEAQFTVTGGTVGTARIVASAAGTLVSADVTISAVAPPPPVIDLQAISPSLISIQEQFAGSFVVTLTGAPTVDTVISLSSTPNGRLAHPASVTVLAGQTSRPFTVTANTVGTATLNATLGGGSTKSSTVTVTAAPVQSADESKPLNIQLWYPTENIKQLQVPWTVEDTIADYGYPIPGPTENYWTFKRDFCSTAPNHHTWHSPYSNTAQPMGWSYNNTLWTYLETGAGDWLDSTWPGGVSTVGLNGASEYSAVTISATPTNTWYEWDITALALKWKADPIYNNYGVYVRRTSGAITGSLRFRSRNYSDPTFHPKIRYTYSDGSVEEYSASIDLKIQTNTQDALGEDPTMLLPSNLTSNQGAILVWWNTAAMPNAAKTLTSAKMRLFYEDKSAGSGSTLVKVYGGRIPVEARGPQSGAIYDLPAGNASLLSASGLVSGKDGYDRFIASGLWWKMQHWGADSLNISEHDAGLNASPAATTWQPGSIYTMQCPIKGQPVSRVVYSRWRGGTTGRGPGSPRMPIWPEAKDAELEWELLLESDLQKQHPGETGFLLFEGLKHYGFFSCTFGDDISQKYKLPDGRSAPRGLKGSLQSGNGGDPFIFPTMPELDGRTGWSFRTHIQESGNRASPRNARNGGGHILGMMGEQWGNAGLAEPNGTFGVNMGFTRAGQLLRLGEYNRIKIRTRVNTVFPDGGYLQDGIIQCYINGYLAFDARDWLFRRGPDPLCPVQPGYSMNGNGSTVATSNELYYEQLAAQRGIAVPSILNSGTSAYGMKPGEYTAHGIRGIWWNNYHGGTAYPTSTFGMRVCNIACRVLERDADLDSLRHMDGVPGVVPKA